MNRSKSVSVLCFSLLCSLQSWAGLLDDIQKGLDQVNKDRNQANESVKTPIKTKNTSKDKSTPQNIYYAGYSETLKPIKDLYLTGNLDGIERFFGERESKQLDGVSIWESIEKVGLLRWMERGTLYLDQGNPDYAIQSLANAEQVIELRYYDSKLKDTFSTGFFSLLETITGMEEFTNYPGEGFEKVLMLNFKSISYLLNGDRRAYNVTRRAIDWQDIEKRKFDAELRAAEDKLNQEKSKDKETQSDIAWGDSYGKYDKIASRVASAYVNPFGYYVAGMVQDFESRLEPSLRSNAKISYKKALELNPDSKALQKALSDIDDKNLDAGVRVLHLVVGNGFVPEKKVLEYQVNSHGRVVPIKLPIYAPVPSKVARIEVRSMSGKTIATLSQIADIEAITLRHQKDSAAFRNLRVLLSVARAVGVNSMTKSVPILGQWINEFAAPDTRSWMSLPAEILGARIRLRKDVGQLRLVTFDKNNKVLANQVINLDTKSDNFVYARTIDTHIYPNSSKTLWTFNHEN